VDDLGLDDFAGIVTDDPLESAYSAQLTVAGTLNPAASKVISDFQGQWILVRIADLPFFDLRLIDR